MESPKAIGDALDAVCDTLDQHANEIQGWQNKWECAVEMAARAEVDRDMWKANHDNQVAIKRIIAARPDLEDRAQMVEKLMAERNRAQAHGIRQHERIKQLESVPTKEMLADLLDRVKSGAEVPEDVAEYRHLAGEISAWGAKFAEAMRRRDERANRKRISSENVQSASDSTSGS